MPRLDRTLAGCAKAAPKANVMHSAWVMIGMIVMMGINPGWGSAQSTLSAWSKTGFQFSPHSIHSKPGFS